MLHRVVVVEGAIIEDGHGVGDPAVHRLQWLLQIACPQLSAQQDGSSEDLECWPPRRRYAVRWGMPHQGPPCQNGWGQSWCLLPAPGQTEFGKPRESSWHVDPGQRWLCSATGVARRTAHSCWMAWWMAWTTTCDFLVPGFPRSRQYFHQSSEDGEVSWADWSKSLLHWARLWTTSWKAAFWKGDKIV